MRRYLAIAVVLLLPAAVSAQGPGEAKTFDHQFHLGQQDDCRACHLPDAMDIIPEGRVCDDCHDAGWMDKVKVPARITHDSFWYRDHRTWALKPERNCSTCHEDAFCLDCHKAGFADEQGMVNIHRSDYRVTHPIAARADGRACASCHEPPFCTGCHDEFAPEELAFVSHRRGWSDILGGSTAHGEFASDSCQACHTPGTVLGSHEWTDGHAREARRSLTACASCHPDGDVCLKCHSAREGLMVKPHPDEWDDMAEVLKGAGGGKTCRRCH